jgi:hypothetical protein
MSQQYLESILSKYKIDEGTIQRLKNIRSEVEKKLRENYGGTIESIRYSGSYAKSTAISLSYDLDICIYFKKDSFNNLSEMYFDVGKFLNNTFRQYRPRQQRVSWGLTTLDGMSLDVVPARSLGDSSGDAYIYSTETHSYIKTNLNTHKEYIRNSGVRPAIKLMKIWRDLHNVHYKSFALELMTIKALERHKGDPLYNQFILALEYAQNNGSSVHLIDPANSNNDVSLAIPFQDQLSLVGAAYSSLMQKDLEDVIW